MADKFSKEVRSKIMGSIRGTNTGPELSLRSALHKGGFRFRLHGQALPGRPDIVLPKYHAAIFVHGCFWHRCPRCSKRLPKEHRAFWRNKFETNQRRDRKNVRSLRRMGWKAITIWECRINSDIEKQVSRVKRIIGIYGKKTD